jgi:hypothetical protein
MEYKQFKGTEDVYFGHPLILESFTNYAIASVADLKSGAGTGGCSINL